MEDGTAVDFTAEDGTAELPKKVDGTAESHDTHIKTIIIDGAELDTASVINEGK